MSNLENKIPKPSKLPGNPCFSSGPCAKRPGWQINKLDPVAIGRSHRSAIGLAKLQETLQLMRKVLQIPSDYLVAIVPGSDTGAFEMLMWNLLGVLPVQVLYWENFGAEWMIDILTQLKLDNVHYFAADYGQLPDLSAIDCDQDIVFSWNGTSAGVSIPNGDWITEQRKGLTICDAVSAICVAYLPWHKLDATSFSWQKGLGGEAAHGVIVLSPRAVERAKSYQPPWPIPKVFRFVKDGKLIESIFYGQTINTPSMLCVEDVLDALKWAESIGGLQALLSRARSNQQWIKTWVEAREWVDFLCEDPKNLPLTPICLKIIDPVYLALTKQEQIVFVKSIVVMLDHAQAGYDLLGHKSAPACIRIWCGPTVEVSDIAILLEWIDYGYGEMRIRLLPKEGAEA